MQEEVTATVAKAAGGAAISAAFALTPWAVVAAMVGAAVSLHFESSSSAKGVPKLLLGIAAMGFLAAMLAAAVPFLPLFSWTEAIPVAVRAGLFGVLANPIYTHVLQPAVARFGAKQGG